VEGISPEPIAQHDPIEAFLGFEVATHGHGSVEDIEELLRHPVFVECDSCAVIRDQG
jgi:hypothetical protein